MRTKHIIITALLASVMPLHYVAAQNPLSLEECRAMAIENNKQMQAARFTVDKTRFDVRAYKANYLPQFTLQGGYLLKDSKLNKTIEGGYLPTFVPDGSGGMVPNIVGEINGNPVFGQYAYFPDMELELKMNNTLIAGVNVLQPVYTGGKLNAGNRMTKKGHEIARLNEKLTRSEVIVLTDEAYWQHVQANEMVEVAKKYMETVSELYINVSDAFAAGIKSRNDLLKVQVSLNEADLGLKRAENAVRITRMNLCHVIGLQLNERIILTGTLGDAAIDIRQGHDVHSRPEYQMLQKQMDIKDDEVKYLVGDYLPTVAVSGGYNYAYGMKLNGTPLLDNGSFNAMVSVSIPLFGKWEGGNKVRSVRAEQEALRSRRNEAAEKMQLEIMQAMNAYEESLLEVALTAHAVEQAGENLKVSRDHYEAGMETLTGYLEAQASWQKCMGEEINAKATLRLNETRYLKAAGRL